MPHSYHKQGLCNISMKNQTILRKWQNILLLNCSWFSFISAECLKLKKRMCADAYCNKITKNSRIHKYIPNSEIVLPLKASPACLMQMDCQF